MMMSVPSLILSISICSVGNVTTWKLYTPIVICWIWCLLDENFFWNLNRLFLGLNCSDPLPRVRNNSGRDGEVFLGKRGKPNWKLRKTLPFDRNESFRGFFSGRTRIIPKPGIVPNTGYSHLTNHMLTVSMVEQLFWFVAFLFTSKSNQARNTFVRHQTTRNNFRYCMKLCSLLMNHLLF
jgi:hypothetical protein